VCGSIPYCKIHSNHMCSHQLHHHSNHMHTSQQHISGVLKKQRGSWLPPQHLRNMPVPRKNAIFAENVVSRTETKSRDSPHQFPLDFPGCPAVGSAGAARALDVTATCTRARAHTHTHTRTHTQTHAGREAACT
jgi:hypothetical protein